jgi:predicted glutamine amidotransferase
MCGLFGFSGEKEVDLKKFKILALYNETRGGDSTGIFYNKSNVEKELGSAYAFFNKSEFKQPTNSEDRVIFGHTRKSSSGAKTANNAHPFTYEIEDKFKSAFAHNGTLHFWRTDMKPYIDDKTLNSINVDSLALGLIITDKNYKFLEDYDGAATFLYYDIKEKNTLQVFKGATLNYQNQQVVDRPMFALKTNEGMYFSSLKEALTAIKEEGDEYVDVPINTLLFYKDGKLTKEVVIPRKKEVYTTYNVNNYNSNSYNTNKNLPAKKKEQVSEKKENGKRFWNSTLDYSSNVFRGSVYFNNGRYYRNGHLVHSFYKDDKGTLTTMKEVLSDDGKRIFSTDTGSDKGKVYYFFNGLLLTGHASKDEGTLAVTFRTLDIVFRQMLTSDYKFKSHVFSKLISRSVYGCFAFLNSEISSEAPRFNVYKDGEVIDFKEKESLVIPVKFARDVYLTVNKGNFNSYAYDVFNSDHDNRILAKIILLKTQYKLAILDKSHAAFIKDYLLLNNPLATKFLNSLFDNLATKNLIIEKEDDDIEQTTDELRLLSDLEILRLDAEGLHQNISDDFYKDVAIQTKHDLKLTFELFMGDLETITEMI